MATKQLFQLDQGKLLAAHDTACAQICRAQLLDAHDVAERVLGKFREVPAIIQRQFAEIGRIELGLARNVPPIDAFEVIVERGARGGQVTPESDCRLEFGFDAYAQYKKGRPELRLSVAGRPRREPLTTRLEQLAATFLAHSAKYPLIVVSDLQYVRVEYLMRGRIGQVFRANECFPKFLYAPWLYGGHATPEAMLLEAAKIARDIQAGHAVG